MVSQAVLSVLVVLIPSGIVCAGLSASTASSSTSANGGTNAQFAQSAQSQNGFPATGFGYNGGYYPSYPIYPYGQINPGPQFQAASLSSRIGDDGSTATAAQGTFPPLYAPNYVGAQPNYGPYYNNPLQQQNAYFLQQQLLQQQLLQQQLLQQQQQLNFPNAFPGVPNQAAPSLDSRIGEDDAPNGASGISTSSFSSSSDVNGKKTHTGGIRTAIHKNGKTYVRDSVF